MVVCYSVLVTTEHLMANTVYGEYCEKFSLKPLEGPNTTKPFYG